MRVLYITDQMYLHGGGERVLTNKSNYFIENNKADVYIITSEQKENPPCYPISSEVVFEDLEINYNRTISYFYPSNFIKIPKHYFRLKKTIKRINPDVIVTLSTQFDFYFLPFINRKIPKIKEFHSSRHYSFQNRKKNTSFLKNIMFKINDYIESKYDCLALLTKDEQKYFKSQNTAVVPNSYTNYPDVVSRLDKKVAVSAGRIAPVKQFDHLVTAWSYVAKELPDWELEIYGKGEAHDIEQLQAVINNYEISNQVKICGETNDLEAKMLQSSLYVMSSKTECFPMVLLEAMSCGLPIVSYDCPNGPKNIITDQKDGILTPLDDPKKLGESIISIINNNKELKEKSKNARENVKRFSPKNVSDIWEKLFMDLIKN